MNAIEADAIPGIYTQPIEFVFFRHLPNKQFSVRVCVGISAEVKWNQLALKGVNGRIPSGSNIDRRHVAVDLSTVRLHTKWDLVAAPDKSKYSHGRFRLFPVNRQCIGIES